MVLIKMKKSEQVPSKAYIMKVLPGLNETFRKVLTYDALFF